MVYLDQRQAWRSTEMANGKNKNVKICYLNDEEMYLTYLSSSVHGCYIQVQ